MERFQLAVDLIGTLVWPGTLLLLVFVFHESLIKLLSRLKTISKDGMEFDQSGKSLDSDEIGQIISGNEVGAVGAGDHPSFVEKAIASATSDTKLDIQKQIEKSLMEGLQLFPEEEKNNVLIHELSNARIGRAYDKIYSFIFGSQIQGLVLLHERENGVRESDARDYFNSEVCSKFSEFYGGVSFENWLGFLLREDVVEIVQNSIRITAFGSGFLEYLKEYKVNQTRPY